MKIHLKIFIQACLLTGLAYLLSTCKDKEPPDPCAGVERVSAEFVMGQSRSYSRPNADPAIDIDTLLITPDTALTGVVTFQAQEEGEGVTYEWQVGNEQNTSTQRQFFLVFGDPVYNIPIRLIVRRPNSTCFPDGMDADTLTKRLTVIDTDDNPLFGTYEGSLLSNPSDVFEVKLLIINPNPQESIIVNLNKGCTPRYFADGFFAYKQGFFHVDVYTQFGCLSPNGWAVLDDDDINKVQITFQSRTFGAIEAPMVEDVFIGTRKID